MAYRYNPGDNVQAKGRPWKYGVVKKVSGGDYIRYEVLWEGEKNTETVYINDIEDIDIMSDQKYNRK